MIGKKIRTKAFWPLVILLAAGIAALIVTTCTLEPDLDTVFQNAMDKLGTSYTVSANGANGSATSNKLTFHFAEDIAELEADDITITNGTGKAEKDGALTGGDSDWVLPIKNVERGTIKVKINKEGIQSSERTVTVFDDRITTYTVDSDGESGTTSTTKLTFTFDDDIRGVGLVQGDIAITPDDGSVATITASSWTEIAPNDGTTFTLGVTAISEGTIKVTITKAGIVGTPSANIDIYKAAPPPSDIGYSVDSDGSAGTTDTTLLTFTFDDDISSLGLTDDDIEITVGEDTVATIIASSWVPAGLMDGTTYELGVTVVSEGIIKVKITKAGIDDAESGAIDIFKGP